MQCLRCFMRDDALVEYGYGEQQLLNATILFHLWSS